MSNNKYFSILETLQENNSKPTGLNDRVLLVDGLNTFIRAWAISPVTNDDGVHVGGISGSLLSIGYAIKNIKPTRVILCFDGKGGSQRRRKLFPEYKGNRKPTSNLNRAFVGSDDKEAQRKNMGMQLGRLVNYMDNLPVSILSLDNIEADDTIAYICKQVLSDSQCFIMSSDKDFLQLVDDRITVWSPTKKKLYFKGDVLSDTGIPAHNYLLYRTLTGDKSDNIPGIKGAGLKTLQKRLPILFEDRNISIDEVLKASEDSKLKILQQINSNRDQIELNHKLMQLYDVEISGSAKEKIRNIVDEQINALNVTSFKVMLMEDRLTNIIRNLDFWLRETFASLDAFAKQNAK
jgi:DNA polymerase-1